MSIAIPNICLKLVLGTLQLYWNHISAWVFSCNLLHIFQTPIPKNISGGLLPHIQVVTLISDKVESWSLRKSKNIRISKSQKCPVSLPKKLLWYQSKVRKRKNQKFMVSFISFAWFPYLIPSILSRVASLAQKGKFYQRAQDKPKFKGFSKIYQSKYSIMNQVKFVEDNFSKT